jgi:hypothetical protein
VPQAVALRYRLADLDHVQLERDERHVVGAGQAAEQGGRGQHGVRD